MLKINKFIITNFIFVLIYFIINMLTLISECYSLKLRFEYDKHMSPDVCAVNAKTIYNINSFLINKSDYIRLNVISDFALSWLTLVIGHEYSHGYICRLNNIPYNIDFFTYPFKTHTEINNPYARAYSSISGFSFENKLKKYIIKDQIINGLSYNDSVFVMTIKAGFCGTAYNNSIKANDLNGMSNSWKKLNPKTKLSRNYVEQVIYETSLLDPISLVNYIIVGSTLWTGEKYNQNNINIIPIYDFNLYPTGVTRELSIAGIYNNIYFKFGYEFGKNIWNNNINGLNIDISNIPIYNNSININIRHIKNYILYSIITINVSYFYFKWKYHTNNYDNLEPNNIFSIGCKF